MTAEFVAPPTPDTWWVYLLHCKGDRLYTGITKDVLARYRQHQAGKGARFTKAFPPLALLAAAPFLDHSSALKEEHRIKQLSKPAKLALIATWQSHFSIPTETHHE